MYESPINLYVQKIMTTMDQERENAIMAKISESIGVDVDKGELIKALKYDRQQYGKGYADAKAEYESMLDEIWAELVELQKEYQEYGWAYDDALEIIDKYRKAESEEKE